MARQSPDRKKSSEKGGKPQRPERRLVFRSLDYPLRREMLRRLHEAPGPLSPVEASTMLEEPLSSASYHCTILRNCGSIELVDEQPVRGAVEHFYRSLHEYDRPIVELLEETREEDDALLRKLRNGRKAKGNKPKRRRRRKD